MHVHNSFVVASCEWKKKPEKIVYNWNVLFYILFSIILIIIYFSNRDVFVVICFTTTKSVELAKQLKNHGKYILHSI